nr:HepT-like ribonuclease domain-containing protein [Azospirillum argentinense]
MRSQHSDLPWKNMAALRDVLIHNYLGVDLAIVWDVVMHRLPDVDRRIAAILNESVEDPNAAP